MTLGSHQTTVGKSQSWITPKFIIDDLGPFDLDPCESDLQPWPCADLGYKRGGLGRPWNGFVWLNPPFHRYEVAQWIGKLAAHNNGIALVHARTEAEWFEPIWRCASTIGFLTERLHFHYPDGRRAKANSGAPAVLAAFGLDATMRLAESKIPMVLVTKWVRGSTSAPGAISCQHFPISGLDGKWRCQKCGDAIEVSTAFSRHESSTEAK
jgi:hypothetical protein